MIHSGDLNGLRELLDYCNNADAKNSKGQTLLLFTIITVGNSSQELAMVNMLLDVLDAKLKNVSKFEN